MTESELLKAVAKIDGFYQSNHDASFNLWYQRKGHPTQGGLTSTAFFERNPYTKSRDMATEAVMRWCGDDERRQALFRDKLYTAIYSGHTNKTARHITYLAATATATELCEALVNTVEEYNRKGD